MGSWAAKSMGPGTGALLVKTAIGHGKRSGAACHASAVCGFPSTRLCDRDEENTQ